MSKVLQDHEESQCSLGASRWREGRKDRHPRGGSASVTGAQSMGQGRTGQGWEEGVGGNQGLVGWIPELGLPPVGEAREAPPGVVQRLLGELWGASQPVTRGQVAQVYCFTVTGSAAADEPPLNLKTPRNSLFYI